MKREDGDMAFFINLAAWLKAIAPLVGRAALFGLCICAAAALLLRIKGRLRESAGRLPGVFYIAALTEIIALRGLNMGPQRQAVQWTPLATILDSLREGPLFFLYHTVGNLLWFLPLGYMLRRRRWRAALLAGAAVSAALEACQWLLATGMPDVDDVLLNALGALAGWGLGRLMGKRKWKNWRKT